MKEMSESLQNSTQKQSTKILVLGGYGTFGGRIIRALCKKGHHVIINGRHFHKAQILKQSILESNPKAHVSVSSFDARTQLKLHLKQLKPNLVIHTCGPFQGQNTDIAQTIINAGIHCIDLSDDREYVQNMLKLDDLAQAKGVVAITAASTVPALSSSVLAAMQEKFQISQFKSVKIGISPGQKTDRGLATTEAVLSYLGKQSKPYPGSPKKRFGLQGTYLQKFPNIRSRLMGNCEAPDLDCLHGHFKIESLNFSAGMESKLLHGLLWMGSWLIRLGLPVKLNKYAPSLLKGSRWFDVLGTEDGGMHVEFEAVTENQKTIKKTWFIEATENHGPQIPAIPAILMTEKILSQNMSAGVKACVNLIPLSEYLDALDAFNGSSFRSFLV